MGNEFRSEERGNDEASLDGIDVGVRDNWIHVRGVRMRL